MEVEVIVVDDGSTDGTGEWGASLGHPSVRFIVQRNSGVQVARNRGLESAHGRFIRFLDSDDWLLPGATGRQIAALDRDRADVAYGDTRDAFEGQDGAAPTGQSIGEQTDVLAALLGDRWVPTFAYLYRHDALGGLRWREDVPAACEDLDFILDVAFSGATFAYAPGVVGCYFHHAGERVSRTSPKTWGVAKLNAFLRASATLDAEDGWTPQRRVAVARSALSLASQLVGIDEDHFEQAVRLAETVSPGYLPGTWPRRFLARLLGVRGLERVLHARRTARRRLTQAGA